MQRIDNKMYYESYQRIIQLLYRSQTHILRRAKLLAQQDSISSHAFKARGEKH